MRRAICLALTLPLLTAWPLAAQNVAFGGAGNTDAPVEMVADNLKVNQSTGEAEFTGNVLIAQGEMRLSADRAQVKYAEGDNSKIERMEATGHVTLVSGKDAAEAASAVYEIGSGNITLTGDVLLTQGANVMSGETIVVNLGEGTARASGRVRTVLQPGSKP